MCAFISRFRHTTVIVGLILITMFALSCEREVEPIRPGDVFPAELLKEDFAEFTQAMRQNHPTMQNPQDARRVTNAFNFAQSRIDRDMSLPEFYILIRKASEALNCGHTRLWLSAGHWKGILHYEKLFPYRVFYRDDKAYIQCDYTDEKLISEGSEIISVNDKSMADIIAEFKSIIGSDGNNNTYKPAEMNRLSIGLFPGYIEFPDTYTIMYIPPDASTLATQKIAALPYETLKMRRNAAYPDEYPWPPYDFKIVDGVSAAVITISDFSGEYDYRERLASSFGRIEDERIKNLIIDVRNNDGGDPCVASLLLNYIIDSAYTYFVGSVYGYGDLKERVDPISPNFDGNVYVLADGGSFSTTGHFLALIRFHNLGVIVGDTSGGGYICNGCYDEITLPNTKISVMYPRCRYATAVTGFDESRGIAPDAIITPTIEDILNDRDPALDYVMMNIGEGKP